MEVGLGSFIKRKLMTTFVTSTVFSVLLAFISVQEDSQVEYYQSNMGNSFILWLLVFFMYIGAIVLIYGNLVSIGVEFLQRKWFRQHDWLYVFLLSSFGLVNGVFFQEGTLAIWGMFAAFLYGIIDKWLFKRNFKNKSVKMLVLVPIASLIISWGYFQLTSPPLPTFSKEDAVEFATSGEGTVIENFPKEIGQWEGNIDGFQVKRETSAKEIEDEVYLVTFTEH